MYLKPRFRGSPLHSLYKEIIKYPPEGFEIVSDESISRQNVRWIYCFDKSMQRLFFIGNIWYNLKTLLYLSRQKVDGLTFSCKDFHLVFATQQLIFSEAPWVVDLEFANALVGYGNIKMFRKIVQKVLGSNSCKKIMPWSEWAKRTLFRSLDCKSFEDKMETVHLAVQAKSFEKKRNEERLRLLFVGSTNPVNVYNFELKGGFEVLESFVKLSKKYDDLELVVRSWVPNSVLSKYSRMKNIKFYRTPLRKGELAELYASSDVFVFPSHANLGVTILEAMSYELPVVALDVYDVSEAVEDMKTGVLLEPSCKVPYYTWNGGPNHHDRMFYSAIRSSRHQLVQKLVDKVSLLIENSTLRRRIGMEGMQQVQLGSFSVVNRNDKLKKFFEEAMAS